MIENNVETRKPFNKIEATLTPVVEVALKRYLEIQRQSNEIQEEKSKLQDILTAHLSKYDDGFWFPIVEGVPLKIRFARESSIEYDEETLRSRLGEKYRCILKPDIGKIRTHLDELEEILLPVLDKVGSPDRDKVKEAIEDGVASKEAFAGAFKKVSKKRLAVMRVRNEEDGRPYS